LKGPGVLLKDPGVLLKDPGVLLKDPGVLLKDSGVLLKDPGVLLKDAGVCLKDLGVLLKAPGVILKDTGVLSKDPGVLLKDPGVLLKDPGVLLKDPGVLISAREAVGMSARSTRYFAALEAQNLSKFSAFRRRAKGAMVCGKRPHAVPFCTARASSVRLSPWSSIAMRCAYVDCSYRISSKQTSLKGFHVMYMYKTARFFASPLPCSQKDTIFSTSSFMVMSVEM